MMHLYSAFICTTVSALQSYQGISPQPPPRKSNKALFVCLFVVFICLYVFKAGSSQMIHFLGRLTEHTVHQSAVSVESRCATSSPSRSQDVHVWSVPKPAGKQGLVNSSIRHMETSLLVSPL